ncbi:unnamed protein product, partial [Menidia menidia]
MWMLFTKVNYNTDVGEALVKAVQYTKSETGEKSVSSFPAKTGILLVQPDMRMMMLVSLLAECGVQASRWPVGFRTTSKLPKVPVIAVWTKIRKWKIESKFNTNQPEPPFWSWENLSLGMFFCVQHWNVSYDKMEVGEDVRRLGRMWCHLPDVKRQGKKQKKGVEEDPVRPVWLQHPPLRCHRSFTVLGHWYQYNQPTLP